MHDYRWLRMVLRFDRAGSSWFIPIALFAAPTFVLVEPLHRYAWIVWVALTLYAVWLAVLGVCMATGLALAASRGDELPEQWWLTMLKAPPPTARTS